MSATAKIPGFSDLPGLPLWIQLHDLAAELLPWWHPFLSRLRKMSLQGIGRGARCESLEIRYWSIDRPLLDDRQKRSNFPLITLTLMRRSPSRTMELEQYFTDF